MNDDRYAKYGAATGLIAVVLFVVGFVIVAPEPPDVSAPAAEVSSYYGDEQDGIRASLVIVSVALFFFIWFLGSLTSTLRISSGNPRLPSIAFAGGAIGTALFMLTVAAFAAVAFRPDQATPEVTQAINDLGLVAAAPAAGAFAALFGATALVILRGGALPEWVGWLAAVTAVAQLLPLGVIFTDEGAFAADGALGLLVPVIAFVVTVGALSILIMRLPPEARSLPDRVRGAVTGAASGAAAGASGRPPRT
ncbi:MAG: hypothetical protein ACRDKH_01260 [Solirubrobacterales bacterium]